MPRFFSRGDRRKIRITTNRGQRTFTGKRRLCRVTKICDGDTIYVITRLNKREKNYEYPVRLFGINAPEMKPSMDLPNRDLYKQAAMVVRDRLAEIIPVDSVVCIDFEKEDKFGRLMGVVWMLEPGCCGCRWYPAMSVAEQLLKEGLVIEYLSEGDRYGQHSRGSKTEFEDAHLRRIVSTAAPGPTMDNCHGYVSQYPIIYETADE